jgi:hypothetical protein
MIGLDAKRQTPCLWIDRGHGVNFADPVALSASEDMDAHLRHRGHRRHILGTISQPSRQFGAGVDLVALLGAAVDGGQISAQGCGQLRKVFVVGKTGFVDATAVFVQRVKQRAVREIDLPDPIAMLGPAFQGHAAQQTRLARPTVAAVDHAEPIPTGVRLGEFQRSVEPILPGRDIHDDVAVHPLDRSAHRLLSAIHSSKRLVDRAGIRVRAIRRHVSLDRPSRDEGSHSQQPAGG